MEFCKAVLLYVIGKPYTSSMFPQNKMSGFSELCSPFWSARTAKRYFHEVSQYLLFRFSNIKVYIIYTEETGWYGLLNHIKYLCSNAYLTWLTTTGYLALWCMFGIIRTIYAQIKYSLYMVKPQLTVYIINEPAHMLDKSVPCMYLTTLTLRPCREMVVSTSPALLLQGRLWGGHQEVMALNSSCRSSFWASSSAGDTNVHSFTRICKGQNRKLTPAERFENQLMKLLQNIFVTYSMTCNPPYKHVKLKGRC